MIRTRIAPSPTGYLHIGTARTALFSWLFARKQSGKFILRIEDTDAQRSTQEAIDVILESMEWLGLDWDEGPFYQTQRYDLYREYAQRLLDEGKAYKCYCTPEELNEKRRQAQQEGRNPRYDRTCRERIDQPEGHPFTVRFKTPLEGTTLVHDLVQGDVTFPNEELDDLIILRSDGSPTYNFCVVIDDGTMEMTHVIRGNDHLSNTPKQILMYKVLGFPVPEFAHIPLILGADKARLSKRHGATSVLAYRDEGYLPEALVNFIARLGWSHGDQEIFSRQEMIETFSLDGVGKSAGVFNAEKLLWLNQHYIKESTPERLAGLLMPFLEQQYPNLRCPVDDNLVTADSAWLHEVIVTLQERSKTLADIAEQMHYYFVEPSEYQPKAARKAFKADTPDMLEAVLAMLEPLEPFDVSTLDKVIHQFAEEKDLKLGKVAQPIRLALTGGGASPGLFDVIALCGKQTVLTRIHNAIDWIRAKED
jgi:glutamyl-tRNA synthetase